MLNKCKNCKHEFRDYSVGCFECKRTEDMTDEEYERYEDEGFLPDCPYYDREEVE